jgi:hypothetical protein
MNVIRRTNRMSHVTDIILVTATEDGAEIEDGHPNADLLSKHLSERHTGTTLVKVDGFAGGGKAMQCDVFAAAVNYLDQDDLITALNGVPWDMPESVQLMLKDEHDDTFRIMRPGGA